MASMPERSATRRWAVRLGLVALVAVAFAAGGNVRDSLGIPLSLEGLAELRAWIEGLGWRAPAVYVALVTFRLFLLLSSHLVLIVGGLAFGAVGGCLWGGLGLFLCAVMQYAAGRVLGEEWVRRKLGTRYEAVEDRVRRLGPAPVFAIMAHPAGPLTPMQLAAGAVGLPAWEYALATGLGAPLRAGVYAVLGTSILDGGPLASLAVGVGVLALIVLPLALPPVRRWVLGGDRRAPRGGASA